MNQNLLKLISAHPPHNKLQHARPFFHPSHVFWSPRHLRKRPQPRRAFPSRIRGESNLLPQLLERLFVVSPQRLRYRIQHYCLSRGASNLIADDERTGLCQAGEFLACFDLAVLVPLVEDLHVNVQSS